MSDLMSAVSAGYLDYKDCTLEGKRLDTLEAWACKKVHDEQSKYLKHLNFQVLSSLLPISSNPADQVESIRELVSGMFNDILGGVEKYRSKTEEERYKEVFGEVTEEDVEKLNEHLENKVLKAEQEEESKQQTLKRLERELSNRFRKRIG